MIIDLIKKKSISAEKFNQLTKYIICTDYNRYKSNNVYVKNEFKISSKTVEPNDYHSLRNNLETYIKTNFKKHIIWYVPKELQITDTTKFAQILKDIVQEYDTLVSKEKINLETDSNEDIYLKLTNIIESFKTFDLPDIHDRINESTTFYKLYTQENFIHNIRHIRRTDVDEIDELFRKYCTVHEIQSSKDTLINHYQSNSQFSVFHLHFIEDDNNIDEIHNNYINMSETRPLIWNKVKYTDFSNKTMLVFILLNANKTPNKDTITEYLKRSHRDKIAKDIKIIDLKKI
jgi:hypothetical protein